ncbi:WSC-domain-containing protein [Polychaeton citri CBS 116435]|uniref:WSC-domain-containing protein n=1 Tax=Polychaeton citri CBS 116435 TaxID=1314669 RepID=A0A9P4QF93_9PEZI|nr:WSC-domain-containing protein [Polychaeton citri CBS 116435]
MRFSLTGAVLAASSLLSGITSAQQYQGEVIPNSLPTVLNSEITYFKIKDPRTTSKTPANLTLINYMSLNTSSKRPQDFKKIQRAVIVVHGLNRDPGTYEANMLSALSQVEKSAGLTTDNVAIMAPYFAGGADKNYGFPWDDTNGSTSSALVWYASQWSAGAINQYPSGRRTAGSFDVMDQVVQWFGNKTVFPNLKQIVVSGHSLGAQFVQRYAMVGKTATQLGISTPIAYWIGDPNSMVWPSLDRPLSTNSCPTYDEYREGFTDYLLYGGDVGPKRNMTYNLDLVDAGRPAILSNFQSKQIHWARALQDFGDQSDDCDAETTGKDRNERFFNFIKQFPVSCDNPAGGNCDTVDFVNAGHDGGALFASPAGRARLFLDNFDGTGKRAYDFGYPRIASYDDPYPDPSQSSQALIGTDNTAYSGGYTYQGCFSDQDTVQSIKTIRNNSYTGSLNTREYCISVCASGGYSIAGVENGNQCYCGNAVSSETAQVAETECSNSIIAVKCAGNSNQYCGGSNRIALFATGNITHSAPVKNPDTIGNYTNQGCYTEGANGVRALNGAGTTSNKMTMEYCANYCSAYKWFGVEYAQECYCANTLATTANKTADGECNMQCPGSDSEFCGAGNRLNVYMNPNWVAGSTGGGNTGGGNTGSGTTGPACPGSNNTVYTSNGKNFTVECGIDHSGGDLTSLSAQSLGACLDACAQNDKCVDVSLSGTACYLKSSLGKAVSAPGIVGGFLSSAASPSSTSSGSSTTPTGSATGSTTSTGTTTSTSAIATSSSISCPASNNTIYTSNSKNFTVECGIDHQGGDLTSLSASSLAACIDACAQNDKCVDVSLSGSACYLKSSLGKAISAPGVFGGYLNTAATSSTASSTVSATASSSSSSSATGTSTGTSTSGSSSSSSTASSSSSSTSASATPSAVSCPASNNTVYTAKSGQTFLIECDTDHQGGDIASQGVASFADCINACDANTKLLPPPP